MDLHEQHLHTNQNGTFTTYHASLGDRVLFCPWFDVSSNGFSKFMVEIPYYFHINLTYAPKKTNILTFKKWNEIQKCCIHRSFSFLIKLKWLDRDTIFWLKAIFKSMSTHIYNFTWISIKFR